MRRHHWHRTNGREPPMPRPRRQGSLLPTLAAPVTLSVVMPVFNEADTVVAALTAVLGVEIPGVALEVVVVESNSSDASRRLVQGFESDPRVRIVLQDRALGKGNAVREGLRHITGDVVLVQDADLEYSVDDYPRLIEPILAGRTDFVLGCRHVPGRPIRVMDGARRLSRVLDVAHWLFTGLFDFVYGVRLRDPFTMYKVFRSACLDGVLLTSNRFDFDWELVGKLVRLGYVPVEVPVGYAARSFASGKKIRFFRDPPTWVAACFRFRFARLRDPAVQPREQRRGAIRRSA
ncbi:MAG TPA: glycosyltransferase family 2 protein [Acidimicrobiia bacterium]|nr:glycosyltransferase family 2 protein [Acidimicrobiia bacterium]